MALVHGGRQCRRGGRVPCRHSIARERTPPGRHPRAAARRRYGRRRAVPVRAFRTWRATGTMGSRRCRESRAIARPGAACCLGLTVQPRARRRRITSSKRCDRNGIPEKPTHHWTARTFLAAVRASGLSDHRHRRVRPQRARVRRTLRHATVREQAGERRSAAPARTVRGSRGRRRWLLAYTDGSNMSDPLFRARLPRPGPRSSGPAPPRRHAIAAGRVADVLHDQDGAFGGGHAARSNIERLRDPEAVAVVTGQQPALFGGPLYNMYKAATAVRLARRLEATTGPCRTFRSSGSRTTITRRRRRPCSRSDRPDGSVARDHLGARPEHDTEPL